jgi:hypothetical protein
LFETVYKTGNIEALAEEALIDAYGESEQRVGCLTMLENSLAVPFTTGILGVPVRVKRVSLNDAWLRVVRINAVFDIIGRYQTPVPCAVHADLHSDPITGLKNYGPRGPAQLAK